MLKGKMSSILKQAQEMQKNMESIQEELGDLVVKSDTAGGMVTATANGKQEILKIEALEEDKEMLEDLIVSSVNRVLKKAQNLSQEKMNSVAGGMLSGLKIPGM